MAWLGWSDNSDSCAGISLVIGGTYKARQVRDCDPDEKGYTGSVCLVWAWG